MPRVIHITILTVFAIGLFMSLWLLSSCGSVELARLQPFATYHGSCSAFMGSKHVQLWRDLFLTFVITAGITSAIALAIFAFLHAVSLIGGKRLGFVPLFNPAPERSPHMKFWDPFREAFSRGTIQHGSRNQ